MKPLSELAARWRQEAATFRRYGQEGPATMAEAHAADLETALHAAAAEELTLQEAAALSGYSDRRLRELVAAGELRNVGRKGAPRFQRGDLPRKPKQQQDARAYDPDADARDLATRLRAS